MKNHDFFKSAGYGMMMHFGLYSMLGGEYKGQKVMNYAEWVQSNFAIPNAEYEKLAAVFNPIYFNAEEWVLLAKEAGMKVCGVYDDSSKESQDEMKAACHRYIYDFNELL